MPGREATPRSDRNLERSNGGLSASPCTKWKWIARHWSMIDADHIKPCPPEAHRSATSAAIEIDRERAGHVSEFDFSDESADHHPVSGFDERAL